MQIDPSGPVGSLIQGVQTTPSAGAVNREKENPADQQANEAGDSPDYQLSLSEKSKQAMAELSAPAPKDAVPGNVAMSEPEAQELAGQVSAQLAQQPNTGITNLAIQKAVDLFT